jgi:hypothetical protein
MSKKIQELFSKATVALRDLEEEIQKEYKYPEENINIEKFYLINIPPNYIRRASEFKKAYKLEELIDDKTRISNLSYALQFSDLLNYKLNRFNYWGIMKNLMIKHAIINIYSVIEGILYGVIIRLNHDCRIENAVCNKAHKCKVYIKSRNKLSFYDMLEVFKSKIGFYNKTYFEKVSELKAIRDNIHIEDIQYNELLSEENKYTIENYNYACMTLQATRDVLPDMVNEFEKNRAKSCTKNKFYLSQNQ